MVNSKSNISNTGYKGVCFRKDRGKFCAMLSINSGERCRNKLSVNIGHYDTLKEAIVAREKYIKSLL